MLEDVLFLAMCAGMPILMALALFWVAFGAVRSRLRMRNLGWASGNTADVAPILVIAPSLGSELHDLYIHGDLRVVTAAHKRSSAGQPRVSVRRVHLLIWPQAGVGRGLIVPRTGGILEAAVSTVAKPHDLAPEWAWARVLGPIDATWFTPERGKALGATLSTALHLLDGHVAVIGPSALDLMTGAETTQQRIGQALALNSAAHFPE